jgi:hypothetical protein
MEQQSLDLELIRRWAERYHEALEDGRVAHPLDTPEIWHDPATAEKWSASYRGLKDELRAIGITLADKVIPAVKRLHLDPAPFDDAGQRMRDLKGTLNGPERYRDHLTSYYYSEETVIARIAILLGQRNRENRAPTPHEFPTSSAPHAREHTPKPLSECPPPGAPREDEALGMQDQRSDSDTPGVHCPVCDAKELPDLEIFTDSGALVAHFQECCPAPNPEDYAKAIKDDIDACRAAYRKIEAALHETIRGEPRPVTEPEATPPPGKEKSERRGRPSGSDLVRPEFERMIERGEIRKGQTQEDVAHILRRWMRQNDLGMRIEKSTIIRQVIRPLWKSRFKNLV